MADTNTFDSVARIYKGYFQIYDGSTAYLHKELVELKESINANVSVHYDTAGKKNLVSGGSDAKYVVTVRDTAELYDKNATPTDKKSISYFVDKLLKNEIPPIEFEGVEVSDAATDKFIRSRFKGGVVGTDLVRNNETFVYERTLTIEITEKVKVQRTTA